MYAHAFAPSAGILLSIYVGCNGQVLSSAYEKANIGIDKGRDLQAELNSAL